MSDLRTVDLFCGGGGLSQGLQNAGFEVVAAYDHWKPAVDFYNRNIEGNHAHILDLSNIEESVAVLRHWNPAVIVGGPPCQDFSSAGKRDENGERANLSIAYAKIVTSLRPHVFIMENVDRALKTRTFKDALAIFRENGYALNVTILDASLCGVPQHRKRTIVIGVLDGEESSVLPVLEKEIRSNPMTVREYLGNDIDTEYYYRHPRSYARRAVFCIDEPSPTIRGVNRPIPKGYPGHPGDVQSVESGAVRPLTTKERSLIQTFPKEWDVSGCKSEIEQIIGNAVPVKLAEFVGNAIVEYLSNQTFYDEKTKSLQLF